MRGRSRAFNVPQCVTSGCQNLCLTSAAMASSESGLPRRSSTISSGAAPICSAFASACRLTHPSVFNMLPDEHHL